MFLRKLFRTSWIFTFVFKFSRNLKVLKHFYFQSVEILVKMKAFKGLFKELPEPNLCRLRGPNEDQKLDVIWQEIFLRCQDEDLMNLRKVGINED